jgi:hypothetical protein
MSWQSINTAPKDNSTVLIGRWNGDGFEYIHAAFQLDGLWFLPFDSARDERGTTYLASDELPTHWMEINFSLEGVIGE